MQKKLITSTPKSTDYLFVSIIGPTSAFLLQSIGHILSLGHGRVPRVGRYEFISNNATFIDGPCMATKNFYQNNHDRALINR